MIEFTEITDFNAPELDVYARLTEAQLLNRFEPKKGMFIAESPKVIGRALDAGCRPVSLLVERSHCNEEAQAAIARCGDVPVYGGNAHPDPAHGLPADAGDALRHAAAQAAGAEGNSRCLPPGGGAGKRHEPHQCRGHFPQRGCSGHGCGAADLRLHRPSLSPQRPGEYGHGFSGALGLCAGELAGNPERGGLSTAAMALTDDSVSIDAPVLRQQERLAVVLGTEGDGLAEQTIARCDYTVKIPMYHGVDSLNVAAASAVAFWELRARF